MKPTEGALDFVSTKVSVLGEMAAAGEIVLSHPQCVLWVHTFSMRKHTRTALPELWVEEKPWPWGVPLLNPRVTYVSSLLRCPEVFEKVGSRWKVPAEAARWDGMAVRNSGLFEVPVWM